MTENKGPNGTIDEFNSFAQDLSRFTDRLARRCREECKTNLAFAMHMKIMEKQGDQNYRIEDHYALSTPTETENQEYSIGGEAGIVRERAAIMALDMLRKYLLNKTQVVWFPWIGNPPFIVLLGST